MTDVVYRFSRVDLTNSLNSCRVEETIQDLGNFVKPREPAISSSQKPISTCAESQTDDMNNSPPPSRLFDIQTSIGWEVQPPSRPSVSDVGTNPFVIPPRQNAEVFQSICVEAPPPCVIPTESLSTASCSVIYIEPSLTNRVYSIVSEVAPFSIITTDPPMPIRLSTPPPPKPQLSSLQLDHVVLDPPPEPLSEEAAMLVEAMTLDLVDAEVQSPRGFGFDLNQTISTQTLVVEAVEHCDGGTSIDDLLPLPQFAVRKSAQVSGASSQARTPELVEAILLETPRDGSLAFSTFAAVAALVRLQRRVKRRYNQQRDDLLNSLGI